MLSGPRDPLVLPSCTHTAGPAPGQQGDPQGPCPCPSQYVYIILSSPITLMRIVIRGY